jgi:hypothetical protein
MSGPTNIVTEKPLNKKKLRKSTENSCRVAGISTLIVVPAVIFFLTFNLIHAALTIMFIAIL